MDGNQSAINQLSVEISDAFTADLSRALSLFPGVDGGLYAKQDAATREFVHSQLARWLYERKLSELVLDSCRAYLGPMND